MNVGKILEQGAFYVIYRGYVVFARLFQMHQAGAFFVTRAKSNMNTRHVYSAKVGRSSGSVSISDPHRQEHLG